MAMLFIFSLPPEYFNGYKFLISCSPSTYVGPAKTSNIFLQSICLYSGSGGLAHFLLFAVVICLKTTST
jgi:hypothetical protein